MKKYKLLKDLPLVEAGTICHIENYRDDNEMPIVLDEESRCVLDIGELQHLRKNNKFNDWFEEIEESKPWEPKDNESYFYISSESQYLDGRTHYKTLFFDYNRQDEARLSIGNCFETKEDVDKAVEKLKALKRLRDYGFRFSNWKWVNGIDGEVELQIRATVGDSVFDGGLPLKVKSEVRKDLDLLFEEGGLV